MDLIFLNNQKGKSSLLLGGYRLNLSKINKETTLWRCVNRKDCSATVTLDLTKTVVLRQKPHTCESDFIKNEVLMTIEQCKKDVCVDFGPIQSIYEKKFEPLKQKGKRYLAEIPTFGCIKNALYRARKKFLGSRRLLFENIKDVEVPNIYKPFFVCEDGEGNEKILIFATALSKKTIKSNKKLCTYFGDGTFRCVPKPFYQLFSVHADLGSTQRTTFVVPVAYGLLPNKNEATYSRFFKLLRDKLGFNPAVYKCDYEQAQINGIKNAFPETKISGCFYHFNKAVWKKSKELNATLSEAGRKITRLCALLPLLPARRIPEAWASILEESPVITTLNRFLKYFKQQWKPLITPGLLSCADDRHRTTNPLEGWHRRLNANIKKNPNFFYFLHKLRQEAKHVDIKITDSIFSTLAKNRKNYDIVFDEKLKNLLSDLNQNKFSAMTFLKKIVYLKLGMGVKFSK